MKCIMIITNKCCKLVVVYYGFSEIFNRLLSFMYKRKIKVMEGIKIMDESILLVDEEKVVD